MKPILIAVAAVLLLGSGSSVFAAAVGEGDWKQRFETVCAGTQDAMTCSPEELRSFIVECDALLPVMEKLEGAERKVYLKRLKMCRDLYAYVLEAKEQE